MNYFTQNLSKMNFWRVLLVSIVIYIIDFIWYSPWIAGNAMMESFRITPDMMPPNMIGIFISALIGTILIVYGWSAFIASKSVKEGIKVSLFVMILLIIPGTLITGMFGGFTTEYLALMSLGGCIHAIVMGAMIAKLRKA